MKNRKKKVILLVPPGGSKIKTVGVPWKLLAVAFVVLAAGFAGYLIPFNSFTLDVVKQNQERNLESQNRELRGFVRPLYRMRVTLSAELERLDRKRQVILAMFGRKSGAEKRSRHKTRVSGQSPDQLVARVKLADETFKSVTAMFAARRGCFDSIPLIRLVDDHASIGARFGLETDPFTGRQKLHFGTDFIGLHGMPVVATASGTVTRVEDGKIWGKRIVISHGFGYSTVYAHLGTVDAFTGKKVSKGSSIGTIGISGVTTGPHLHYEVLRAGTPIDPEEMFYPDIDSLKQLPL